MLLFISNVFAAVYSTSATKVVEKVSVAARTNWTYETGKYSGRGNYTVNSWPTYWNYVYGYEYLSSYRSNSDYTDNQQFRIVQKSTIAGTKTYSTYYCITLQS